MVLKLLLWILWSSPCISLSSLTTCSISHNAQLNGLSVDCHGRYLTEIPKHFPANTTSVDLSYNGISTVSNFSFLGMSRLQALNLSYNVITKIEPLAFSNCNSLRYLHIKFNQVFVNGSVFDNFGNLQELAIDDHYDAEIFKPLSALTTIDVVTNVECSFEGFQYLLSLRVLHIGGVFSCQNETFATLNNSKIKSLWIEAHLSHMDTNALAPLKYLQELTFRHTESGLSIPLNALYPLVGKNLTKITMESINIQSVKDLKEVEERTLTKEKLKFLSHVCVADLSLPKNSLVFIDFMFLMNSPIAKCLKRLTLYRNMISNPRKQVFLFFWKLRQLEYINASDQSQFPGGTESVPDRMKLSDISLQENFENDGLVIISFPENLTEIIGSRSAVDMGHFKYDVIIKNGNRLKKLDLSFNGITTVANIFGLSNIDYVDLSGNEKLSFPDTFFCNCKTIKTLRMTDMSLPQTVIDTQGITFFRCLPRLKTLSIAGNRLVQLPPDLFELNLLLEYLDLSRNIFVSIPIHLSLLPKLIQLDVSFNSFGSLDQKTTVDIDNHYQVTDNRFRLKLKGNFFECSCTNLPFLFWLSETEVLSEKNTHLSCITENGNITTTGEITDNMLKFWRKCKGGDTLSISSILGTLFLCCVLAALLVDTNKTKLAYIFINALKHKAPKRSRQHFKKDVYVSYADMDYRWACHELGAILEERDLSLFIWDRDSVPGDCTAEVITENVNQCWKSILYFTENYERDAWSYLTTMAAVNCVDNVNPERLILLLPENENPQVPECLLQVVPENCIFYVPKHIGRHDAFWDELERAIKKET